MAYTSFALFQGFALASAVIVILAAFGFLVATVELREREWLPVLGFTFTLGPTVFFLLADWLGFVSSIRAAFILSFLLIALLDLAFLARWVWVRERIDLPAFRPIVWLFLLLIALVGFTNARFLGSDPWSWQHFPLASTIAAGNFPVMTPINPVQRLAYHYAPALFAAGFSILTHLSLAVGFALEPLVGGAGILLFAGALASRKTRSHRAALLVAILALAGSGLVWLKGASLFLHWGSGSPFRVLSEMVGSPLTTSPFAFLGHRSTAMGFPLLFGLLWCIAQWLEAGTWRKALRLLLPSLIFALGLTLTMELAFVTLSASVALLCVPLLCMPSLREKGVRFLEVLILVFLPVFLIARFQGGVLTSVGTGGSHSFAVHFSPFVTYDTYGHTAAFWSLQFLRDFGFPLLLFPLGVVFAWFSRRSSPLLLLLAVLAALHLLLPFVVEYRLIRGEMHRAFYVFTSVGSFLAGLVLWEWCLRSPGWWLRLIGWGIVASMLLSSAVYFALRITIPTMRFERAPLFAGMPAITPVQEQLYRWVRTNTEQRDFFYVRNLTQYFEEIPDTETVQMRDRVLFMTYTGRFTVGPIIFWDYPVGWLLDVLSIENSCDIHALLRLRIAYLLVETPDRARWFTSRCDPSHWLLRYDGGTGGAPYPRVYELEVPFPASPPSPLPQMRERGAKRSEAG